MIFCGTLERQIGQTIVAGCDLFVYGTPRGAETRNIFKDELKTISRNVDTSI